MRIRLKHWAKEELSNCKFYIDNPILVRDNWKNEFNNLNKIHLELGCGKGEFIAKLSHQNNDINYIAVDMNESVLGVAIRNINEVFNDSFPANLRLTRLNIENFEGLFSEQNFIDRIYINFPTPWEKPKHYKRRLTHTNQLLKYKPYLKNGGEIYFKTDSNELYLDTLEYLKMANFEIVKYTDNIYKDNIFVNNITTLHEEMYLKNNITIKGIIAKNIK